QPIADAIRNDQGLGLTPSDDGRVVRVNLPPMTEENRRDMVKLLNQKVEECLISARNARHEAFRKGDEAEKSRDIGKDERLRIEKQIDDLLAKQKGEVEGLAQAKESEIMTV
ncbi:MAG TPA: ribosome-recycling factor, partial [Candidatus Saccharimonadales bacterium]|nr:ribosome-recycling factor [Candidatus Saccharimonadales bacterium]